MTQATATEATVSLSSEARSMPGDSHHRVGIPGHGKTLHPSLKKKKHHLCRGSLSPQAGQLPQGGVGRGSQPQTSLVKTGQGAVGAGSILGAEAWAGAGAVAAQLLSSVRMTHSSLVRTQFFSASCRECSRENGDVSTAKGREKSKLVKRQCCPQEPLLGTSWPPSRHWGPVGMAGGSSQSQVYQF